MNLKRCKFDTYHTVQISCIQLMNSEKVMKVMNAFSKKVISLAVDEYVRCTLFIFLNQSSNNNNRY